MLQKFWQSKHRTLWRANLGGGWVKEEFKDSNNVSAGRHFLLLGGQRSPLSHFLFDVPFSASFRPIIHERRPCCATYSRAGAFALPLAERCSLRANEGGGER